MAIWGKLSGRLVALTIVFVMLSEILLFVPSVAYFRHDFLSERLERAEIASLAVLVDRSGRIQPELERQLLADAGVMAISRLRAGRRELVLSRPLSEEVVRRYRVEDTNIFRLIFDAAKCVLFARDRYILFSGPSMHSAGERIEIVVDDGDLKSEMLAYSVNIFWLSLFISIMTATLVFLAINAFLVRPMGRLIEGVISFREDPDDPERIIRPSGSKDEIGDAERELAETQREVQAALKQRTRLAALGGALAKVSHDLRNILASTQLFTERLELSQDPMTARVAPKLVRAVDRAIRLCEQTLRDGRADEPPPAVNEVDLHALADEVAAAIGADARAEPGAPPDPGRLVFENRVPPGFAVTADPDQLFRAVLNLSRNAGEAILSSSAGAGVVAVEARETSGAWVIDVVDDGPGVPEAAQRALFQLYKGSTSRGGSGLGLAISRELARNHGGDLVLAESTAAGARFRITLPRGSSLAGGGGGPAEPARRREVAGE